MFSRIEDFLIKLHKVINFMIKSKKFQGNSGVYPFWKCHQHTLIFSRKHKWIWYRMIGALIDHLRIARKVFRKFPESCWKATEKLREYLEHFSKIFQFLFKFYFYSLRISYFRQYYEQNENEHIRETNKAFVEIFTCSL